MEKEDLLSQSSCYRYLQFYVNAFPCTRCDRIHHITNVLLGTKEEMEREIKRQLAEENPSPVKKRGIITVVYHDIHSCLRCSSAKTSRKEKVKGINIIQIGSGTKAFTSTSTPTTTSVASAFTSTSTTTTTSVSLSPSPPPLPPPFPPLPPTTSSPHRSSHCPSTTSASVTPYFHSYASYSDYPQPYYTPFVPCSSSCCNSCSSSSLPVIRKNQEKIIQRLDHIITMYDHAHSPPISIPCESSDTPIPAVSQLEPVDLFSGSLDTTESVLAQNAKLRGDNKMGALAVALAKHSFFGVEVMK